MSSPDALIHFYSSTSLTDMDAGVMTKEAATFLEAQDNMSSSDFASCKSAVSKPSMNQP